MQEKMPQLSLTLFDAGGAAGAGSAAGGDVSSPNAAGDRAGSAAAEGGQDAAAIKDTKAGGELSEEQRRAAFDELIKGKYKDLFSERTQKIIDKRFKEAKSAEDQLARMRPILSALAGKYGADAEDIEGMLKALEGDPAFLTKSAQDKPPEEVARPPENSWPKRPPLALHSEKEREKAYSDWLRQGEDAKKIYPGFDLRKECKAPGFVKLLRSGIDVRTAFEVTHQQEILGGAMRHTADEVAKKVLNNVRARGMRPAENGTTGRSAAAEKKLPDFRTRAGRENIARRVQKGERIEF